MLTYFRETFISLFKKILLSFVIALIFSRILFINNATTLIGDGGDNYEFLGFMYFVKENILADRYPFAHTDILRYPVGFNLSYGYDGALAIITGATLGSFMPMFLAYNLSLVFVIFLNIFLSSVFFKSIYLLYRDKVPEGLGFKAFIAGVIFGLSPYVFARLSSHINLAFIGGFPVFLFGFLTIYEKVKRGDANILRRDYATILAGVLLVALGSLQYLIILGEVLVMVSLISLLGIFPFYNAKFLILNFSPKHLKKITMPLITFVIVFMFFFQGFVIGFISGDLMQTDRAGKYFKPGVMDFIVPNDYLGSFWSGLNPSDTAIERVIAIGLAELVLLLILMIRDKENSKYVLIFSFIFILAATDILRLPLVPEGGRLVIFMSFMLALFYLFSNLNKMWMGMLILSFLILERGFFTIKMANNPAISSLEIVRSLPGEAVFHVPLSKYDAFRSYLPSLYDKKILDGYFHYTADNSHAGSYFTSKYFSRFQCDSEKLVPTKSVFYEDERPLLLEKMRGLNIGSLVLLRDPVRDKFLHTGCTNVRDWWYWVNPPHLTISSTTANIQSHLFQLTEEHPRTRMEVYTELKGNLTVNGISYMPGSTTDLTLILPGGKGIIPEWKPLKQGLAVEFDPPIKVELEAGQAIRLEAPTKMQDNEYISIYYSFEESADVRSTRKKHPFEPIVLNDDVEVYLINY